MLQKQQKTIEILEKEKCEVLFTLSCEHCPANEIKAEKDLSELKRLINLHEKLAKSLENEKTLSKELDQQLRKIEKNLEKLKQKAEPRNFSEILENRAKAQHQLENRLHVVSNKFIYTFLVNISIPIPFIL